MTTPYTCTKTYGAELGLSAVFRQHAASSHCRHLHGYALGFAFCFGAEELDDNGWVLDFGSLGELRAWLRLTFDHSVLVARDDPQLDLYTMLQLEGLARVVQVERTGCEAFARMAAEHADDLVRTATGGRARLLWCECREHAGNAATYSVQGDA